MSKFICISVSLFAFLANLQSIKGQDGLTEKRFRELMRTIVPNESSSPIEWQTNLLVAQNIALEQKKPIFIWSMDGNPLGCT